MELTRKISVIACAAMILAGMLSETAIAGSQSGGRVDSSTGAGLQRPVEVKYTTGRVDPNTGVKGIFHHTGVSAGNGRTG